MALQSPLACQGAFFCAAAATVPIACLAGTGRDLATGLIKPARENLANLHPHPLYAAHYYSHPPVVARVRRLLEMGPNREV